MKKLSSKDAWNESFRQLREKASTLLKLWDDGKRPSHKDPHVAELLDELKLLHIELDLQNDELLVERAALEEARDRYQRFYDRAPVGYLTISAQGKVVEGNLLGAKLLKSTVDLIKKKTPELASFCSSSKKEASEIQKRLIKFLSEEKSAPLTLPLKGKETRLIRLDFLFHPEGLAANQTLALVRDVTDEMGKDVAMSAITDCLSLAMRGLAHSSGNDLWIVDKKGKILFSSNKKSVPGRNSSLKECLPSSDWQHFKIEVSAILQRVKAHGVWWKSKADVIELSGWISKEAAFQLVPLDTEGIPNQFLVFRI